MNLWVNNKPAKVYVPPENLKQTYKKLQSRLSKEGSIPMGIDHLPDNIIEANPILAKLDLLNVGEITEIEYANDTITSVEAELTNPLIRTLYEAGELDMVSIVATSNVSECPNDYDYIVNHTDITRVDIVEKGACPTCNIPKPQPNNESEVVYARYSIKEDTNMAEELTMDAIQEAIKAAVDEATAPINERLDAIEETIAESADDKKPDNKEDESEVEAMKARIQVLEEKASKDAENAQVEAASAKVDLAIQAGKIKPADRDNMIIMARNSTEAFDEYIKTADVIVPIGARESIPSGEEQTEPEMDDDYVILRLNVSEERFNKSVSDEIRSLDFKIWDLRRKKDEYILIFLNLLSDFLWRFNPIILSKFIEFFIETLFVFHYKTQI